MRYVVTVSYDGTDFCGWQSQPNGNSVQDAMNAAASRLFCADVKCVGCGRTDAGVHALGAAVHFDAQKVLPLKNVVGGLNAYLPSAIRVLSADVADDSFDARKSAKRKTYMYFMYTAPHYPVLDNRALRLDYEPNIDKLNSLTKAIIGKHDFSSFMAAGGSAKTFTRNVFDAHFERDGIFIKFFITADGFLYNMVRIIVAQLLKAERGKADIADILARRDRAFAKELAPACGLYLYSVEYDKA